MTVIVILNERLWNIIVIPIPTYVGTRHEHHCHFERTTMEHHCHSDRVTQERRGICCYNQQISPPTAVGVEMTGGVIPIPTYVGTRHERHCHSERMSMEHHCHSDRATQERRGICCYNQQISPPSAVGVEITGGVIPTE